MTRGRYAPDIRVLPPAPVSEFNGILLSVPPAMIGHCAWVLDPRASLVVADAALAMGLCQPKELNEWAESQFGKKHAGRLRWLAQNADAGADSPGETLTRLAVTGLGYDVVSQFRVELTDRLAFIDLLIQGTKVAIEFQRAHQVPQAPELLKTRRTTQILPSAPRGGGSAEAEDPRHEARRRRHRPTSGAGAMRRRGPHAR